MINKLLKHFKCYSKPLSPREYLFKLDEQFRLKGYLTLEDIRNVQEYRPWLWEAICDYRGVSKRQVESVAINKLTYQEYYSIITAFHRDNFEYYLTGGIL